MTLIRNRPSPSESAPANNVVIATASTALARRVSGVLADDQTSIVTVSSIDEIEARESAPDMLILDASSPELVAPRLLSRLRHRWQSVLLVAVSVPDEAAAAELLDAGVDDAIEARSGWTYVAARLNASARRTRTANAQLRRRLGDVVYDRENRRVWCAGSEVEFAPRELAVLDALWMRAGEVVRHESLQDYVWSGIEEGERSNRLEVYISYVRRKLQGSKEVTIETLRGAGYRLVRKDPNGGNGNGAE
jgi:two-component system, OmpR family, response regulator